MTEAAPIITDRPLEQVAVGDLKPYDRNARTHTPKQIEQIVAAIREWGWTNPLLVDEESRVIAGHGRLLAAKKLGMVTVPCIRVSGLSDAQRRALVLADNQLALNAGWDAELLASEIAALTALDFDMPLLGFDGKQLDAILGDKTGLSDPNAIPDVPVNPASRVGDVWLLGGHRLACGDATDPEVVARCLAGAKPKLMVTDPPYGVNYDPKWREAAVPYKSSFRGAGRRRGEVDNDDRDDWTEVWALFPGNVAYVWHGGLHSGVVQASLEAAGFGMRAQIIWAKQTAPLSRGHFHWQHEPCWYAVRKGETGNWQGSRTQTTLWEIQNLNPVGRTGAKGSEPENARTDHSTQKPVECMKRPIENNTAKGEGVFEPFAGSGTTIIAGEMTGRPVFAIELNPVYADVCVLRWQAFAGEDARLESTGQTFADVAVERTGQAPPSPVADAA